MLKRHVYFAPDVVDRDKEIDFTNCNLFNFDRSPKTSSENVFSCEKNSHFSTEVAILPNVKLLNQEVIIKNQQKQLRREQALLSFCSPLVNRRFLPTSAAELSSSNFISSHIDNQNSHLAREKSCSGNQIKISRSQNESSNSREIEKEQHLRDFLSLLGLEVYDYLYLFPLVSGILCFIGTFQNRKKFNILKF